MVYFEPLGFRGRFDSFSPNRLDSPARPTLFGSPMERAGMTQQNERAELDLKTAVDSEYSRLETLIVALLLATWLQENESEEKHEEDNAG